MHKFSGTAFLLAGRLSKGPKRSGCGSTLVDKIVTKRLSCHVMQSKFLFCPVRISPCLVLPFSNRLETVSYYGARSSMRKIYFQANVRVKEATKNSYRNRSDSKYYSRVFPGNQQL
jgi:hypothetical protein